MIEVVEVKRKIKELKEFQGLPSELDPIYRDLLSTFKTYRMTNPNDPNIEKMHEEIRKVGLETSQAAKSRLANADKRALLTSGRIKSKFNDSTPASHLANDITERLQHMNRTLAAENERAVASLGVLARSSRRLAETNAVYSSLGNLVTMARALQREVGSLDKTERRRVQAAMVALIAVVVYVIVARLPVPAIVWPWNWIRLLLRMFK